MWMIGGGTVNISGNSDEALYFHPEAGNRRDFLKAAERSLLISVRKAKRHEERRYWQTVGH